ncbi:helix-turn-helix domain-containing protein [Paenibacillus larvae]
MAAMSDRIKSLREKKGMTQDELANRLNMNRANISNYERGIITNIPSEVLNKMADLFGTSVDYILGRSDDPSPQVDTIAAHFEGDDFTKEEIEEILEYAKYLKSKRK